MGILRDNHIVIPADISSELRKMCDVAFDGILFHENGVIISSNATAAGYLGYSLEGMQGRSVDSVISFTDQGMYPEEKTVLPVMTSEGKIFRAEVMSRRMSLGGRDIVATSIRDVSNIMDREINLRHYRELIERIINNSFDIIVAFSRQSGTVLFVNGNVGEVLGHDPEDFLIENDYLWEVIHPDDAAVTRSLIEEIRHDDARARIADIRLRDCEGRWLWFEMRILVFVMDGTRNDDVLIIFRNVNELRAAYEQIKESEEIFRGMYENSSVGIVQMAPDGGFIRCNRAYSEMVGYSESELRTRNLDDLTHEDFIEETRAGIGRILNRESDSYSLEKKYLRKNGTPLWVSVSVSAIWKKNGEVESLLGMVTDIQSRKTYEEQLRYLSLAVEQSPLSVVLTDVNATIQYVNSGFVGITGYAPDEVLGKKPSILKSGKHDREFYANLWNTLISGNTWRGEMVNRRKNGEEFWESSVLTPIFDHTGKIIHYLGIKEDITEKKRNDVLLSRAISETEKANKVKSDFLANMSHEIRTPINAVVGLSRILRNTDLDRDQMLYVEKMESASSLLLRLVNDILDMAKIEADKLELDHKPFMIWDLMEDVVSITENLKHAGDVEFSVIADRTIPPLIGDSFRLSQVLTNLLSNAFKFTEKGEVVVEISRLAGSEDSAELRFSVRDTGIGVKTDSDAIFSAFTQADSSITRKYGGTGLGLTISKRIVELMNGSISVESEPGKGSTFSFVIRFDVWKKDASEERLSLSGKRILIIENGISARRSLDEILSGFGALCVFSGTAEEAFELIGKMRFDAVVADIHEAALIRRIRNDSAASGCELIAVADDMSAADEFRELSSSVIVKPFTVRSVLSGFGIGLRSKEHADREKRGTGRILVVDDNEINLIVICKLLEIHGYTVQPARNGGEVIRIIEAGEGDPFDLIITDIQMPVMGGIELASRIRRIEKYRHIPIIALSGDIDSERNGSDVRTAINEFVNKPVDPGQLYEMIEKYLRDHHRS